MVGGVWKDRSPEAHRTRSQADEAFGSEELGVRNLMDQYDRYWPKSVALQRAWLVPSYAL
ncbi:hypothetical protein thsrh120_62430 [Rhizobium sp. No.120]